MLILNIKVENFFSMNDLKYCQLKIQYINLLFTIIY